MVKWLTFGVPMVGYFGVVVDVWDFCVSYFGEIVDLFNFVVDYCVAVAEPRNFSRMGVRVILE